MKGSGSKTSNYEVRPDKPLSLRNRSWKARLVFSPLLENDEKNAEKMRRQLEESGESYRELERGETFFIDSPIESVNRCNLNLADENKSAGRKRSRAESKVFECLQPFLCY